jgi:H+/Cl- antiporter ClcA
LATLFFNSEGEIIKTFLKWSTEGLFDANTLICFFLVWYFLTIISYGTSIPSGLFLPGILIGCGFGMLIGVTLSEMNFGFTFNPETYAIIGATGILAGYARLTFSLTVLMMETTENVNLFMPVLITCLAANWSGDIFCQSLYRSGLATKQVPFLSKDVPRENRSFIATDIMSSNPKYFQETEKVEVIAEFLKSTKHNGFLVINANG